MNILKFGAVWCNGCLVMRPRWAEIEKEHPWLTTQYVDFDTEKDMVGKYAITSGVLPVCIFLDKDGKEILRFTGEVEKETLLAAITQHKDK